MTLAQPLNYNPDVLTCIANLSNDEVFTPPELANQMLDGLAAAWADANNGADIWRDSSVTFLDPFTKSGVFLREITRRLVAGLADEFPDLTKRVDHILTKQVFGIAITNLTALLARRSVYCSKFANGKYSVASSFETDAGNIWFERTGHTWVNRKTELRADPITGEHVRQPIPGTGRCKFCGAAESEYNRAGDLETHAYAFIHTDDIKARLAELFGADVHFDVIIGNPPYQLREGNSGEGNSASPIYQKFIESAKRLEPRFIEMITPTRWVAGGKGLDEFRGTMLADRRLRSLTDYPDPSQVFGGVNIRGGVSYFLWDRGYDGLCDVTVIRGDERLESVRALDEFDVFVRDPRAVAILRKVGIDAGGGFGSLLSARNPFGLSTNFYGAKELPDEGDIVIAYIQNRKRATGFVSADVVGKNRQAIDAWKVFTPKAGTDGSANPDSVLTRPIVAAPGSVCTDSFLFAVAGSEVAAVSMVSYYSTRFFRFLVSLRKITQDASRETYSWVPLQTWDRTWTDAELYEKYGLTDDEIAFIESQIKPMELGLDSD